jgi:hypothetical protein
MSRAMGGGGGVGSDGGMAEKKQEHPKSRMDWVRCVWMSQGAQQGQRLGDGSHGMTEPELEPERVMVFGCFGLVFAKTASINSGTGLWSWLVHTPLTQSILCS